MVEVPLKPKSVAVDTNVLIDLADGNAEVEKALTALRKRLNRVVVIITPTVVQEIHYLVQYGSTAAVKKLALTAARSLLSWGIVPANCKPAYHGAIELAAIELLDKKLLPPDEKNDALIITEASSAECSLLISSDKHMWDANPWAINRILEDRDFYPIAIKAPWKVLCDYK